MIRLPAVNLYGRLLIGFCVANVITLLVSVAVTERLARAAYRAPPDWNELAQDANRAYIAGGTAQLRGWLDDQRSEGIGAHLLENGRDLLPLGERPPPGEREFPEGGPPPGALPPEGGPPPLFGGPVTRRLLETQGDIILEPRPGMRAAAVTVTGSDGVERRFIGIRGAHPPRPRLWQLLSVQIALSLLVIGVVGWWLARGIARPVEAVGAAARRVAGGDLSARAPGVHRGAGAELIRLAGDFNTMAGRIEALVRQERAVLQDVSHELRSPLARLHLLLDLAQHGAAPEAQTHFERAEREIERLDRLIAEALALARMEAQLPGMAPEDLPLDALLEGRAEAAAIDAEARGIVLNVSAPTPLLARGSAVLIERVLDNLLSNAIKFSPDGGAIELALTQDGANAVITVCDHGPGVPEAELDALFRPFFRGENGARAEGHGLGLAIVDRIVRAHGGSVSAANAEGGGLRVSLRLPALV